MGLNCSETRSQKNRQLSSCTCTRPQVWRRFWKEQGVYVLEHSPYSPDLVHCDFFLFPGFKKNLAGRNKPMRL